MRELSLHLMDIVENGLAAGATLVEIGVAERRRSNRMEIVIRDNGRGIPAEMLAVVSDPFFTTRTTRRVGLGLSLFKEAARRCNGEFQIRSEPGAGTEVRATFELDHIDRAPMGDIAGSLGALIMGAPDCDFLYTHEIEGRCFRLDTREVRSELEGVAINRPEVIRFIAETVREGLEEVRKAE